MARRPFFRRFPHFAVLRGSSRPAAGTKGAPIPAAPLYATPPSQNKNTVIKNSPDPCTCSAASSGLSKGRVKAVLHSATETPPSRRKNTALRGSILVGKKVKRIPSSRSKELSSRARPGICKRKKHDFFISSANQTSIIPNPPGP